MYLREWREECDLTQEELGARMNTNKAQISNWESGGRRPSLKSQGALAAALGIEAGDLFRNPKTQSADALLRSVPPELRDKAINVIKALIGKS